MVESLSRNRLRTASILIAGAAACWFTTAFTASLVFARRSPQLAVSAFPSGIALATLAAMRADSLLAKPDEAAAIKVRELSARALTQAPVSAPAARALSVSTTLAGDEQAGMRYLLYSERLSRRDFATQLLLIELAVRQNDIAKALDHYHKAMQSSRASREILSPVLAAAANDVTIARELSPLLAQRPEWWSDFTGRYTETVTSPEAAYLIAAGLKLDPKSDEERSRLQAMLVRIVGLGRPDLARRLYIQSSGLPSVENGSLVQNGSFERTPLLPPFDWDLQEEQSAVRDEQPGAAGATALILTGQNGEESARQLLTLRPGAYRFTAKAQGFALDSGSGASVVIACGANGSSIAPTEASADVGATKLSFSFVVPSIGCPTQWLIIRSPRFGLASGSSPWIDAIAIAPAR